MGDWLNQRLAESTKVLVSLALRAQQTQTARALGRQFKTVAAVAPDQGVIELLNAANWPDASEPVLVVGYQPTMGMVAAQLLTGFDQPLAVKKAAVWRLRARQRDGFSQVTQQAVQSADLL